MHALPKARPGPGSHGRAERHVPTAAPAVGVRCPVAEGTGRRLGSGVASWPCRTARAGRASSLGEMDEYAGAVAAVPVGAADRERSPQSSCVLMNDPSGPARARTARKDHLFKLRYCCQYGLLLPRVAWTAKHTGRSCVWALAAAPGGCVPVTPGNAPGRQGGGRRAPGIPNHPAAPPPHS